MDTDKVFTGFDKDGKEVLLFMESINTYLNLVNNSIMNRECLDLDTLLKYKETINCFRHLPKKLIIQLYNNDRNKIINTENIYLGRQYVVNNFNISPGYFYDEVEYRWKKSNIKYGLYKFSKSGKCDFYLKYEKYKNINNQKNYVKVDEKIYTSSFFQDGLNCVEINSINLNDLIKEKYTTKKKVYEIGNYVSKYKEVIK